MGDTRASDWTTEAHTRILRDAGAMPAEQQLLHGRPYPRGPIVHALAIDDHVGLASVPLDHTDAVPPVGSAEALRCCFDRAGLAYRRVGL
eukprot:15453100-Alexandrium_andersonii.AAC.1